LRQVPPRERHEYSAVLHVTETSRPDKLALATRRTVPHAERFFSNATTLLPARRPPSIDLHFEQLVLQYAHRRIHADGVAYPLAQQLLAERALVGNLILGHVRLCRAHDPVFDLLGELDIVQDDD